MFEILETSSFASLKFSMNYELPHKGTTQANFYNPTLTVALLLANISVQNIGIRPLTGYFVNSSGLVDDKLFRQLVGAVQHQKRLNM